MNSTETKYRKRPVVIEAICYQPGPGGNCAAVEAFIGINRCTGRCGSDTPYYIHTLEGFMEASPGDYIIRGVKGEFYPCKPDIFEATYEQVSA